MSLSTDRLDVAFARITFRDRRLAAREHRHALHLALIEAEQTGKVESMVIGRQIIGGITIFICLLVLGFTATSLANTRVEERTTQLCLEQVQENEKARYDCDAGEITLGEVPKED